MAVKSATVLNAKTKKLERALAPTTDLSVMVDQAGELDSTIKSLTAELSKLKDTLKENLKPGEVLTGTSYQATITERMTQVIDAKKVQGKLDPKAFMAVISVSMTELKKVMLPEDIDKCVAETKVSEALSIKPVK